MAVIDIFLHFPNYQHEIKRQIISAGVAEDFPTFPLHFLPHFLPLFANSHVDVWRL